MKLVKLVVQHLDDSCGAWRAVKDFPITYRRYKVWRFGWHGFYPVELPDYSDEAAILAARKLARACASDRYGSGLGSSVRIAEIGLFEDEELLNKVIWKDGKWIDVC